MFTLIFVILLCKTAIGIIVTPQEFSTNSYDYIIIGGGTSGLVVANRLTEMSSIRVGVIEAGEYLPDDMKINLPQGKGYLGNHTYDWSFQSIPQDAVDNRQIFYSRGRMVGGSSGINSMIWQHPSKEDLDLWNTAFQNGPQWSFDSLAPYLRKVESWTPPTLLYPGERQSNAQVLAHGLSGPINVSYNVFQTDVDNSVVVAGNKLGIYTSSNEDGGNATGFTQIARSVNPEIGTRSYSASGYYAPYASRNNYHLLTSAQVTKIEFSQKNGSIIATGVQFLSGNETYHTSVKREVILAAGSIQTPQILELSGVGNCSLLQRLGIPLILDLPQVGENLQDHPVSLIDVEVKPDILTLDQLSFNKTYVAEQEETYKSSKAGALTQTASVLGPTMLQKFIPIRKLHAMITRLNETLNESTLTPLQKAQYKALRSIISKGEQGWTEFTMVPNGGLAAPADANKSYITVVAIDLRPFSRGFVHINSPNPLVSPSIDPRFLTNEFDADVLTEGTRFLQKWMDTTPISQMVASKHSPNETLADNDALLRYVRQSLETTNHPLGTAAMAPRSLGGVVDPLLKVYGLQNVRVVDASIIPMSIGVAIMPLVYAVAEKAADLIKEDM